MHNHTASPRGQQLPQPQAQYCYFDKLQIWLHKPLSAKKKREIEQHCAAPFFEDGECWFDPDYHQRVQICRPDAAALKLLAALDDTVLLNYVEITVDFIFHDEYQIQ